MHFTMKHKEFKVTCTDETIECNREPELSSKQEEANTKVFVGAKFAQDLGCWDVGIFTVDSDVPILAYYYSQLLNCWLLLQIGSGSNLRILDIGNNDLEKDLLKSLPLLHALSGCGSQTMIWKRIFWKVCRCWTRCLGVVQLVQEMVLAKEVAENSNQKRQICLCNSSVRKRYCRGWNHHQYNWKVILSSLWHARRKWNQRCKVP